MKHTIKFHGTQGTTVKTFNSLKAAYMHILYPCAHISYLIGGDLVIKKGFASFKRYHKDAKIMLMGVVNNDGCYFTYSDNN